MVNAMNHQLKTAMSPVGVAFEAIGELLRDREKLDEKALDDMEEWVQSARRQFGQSAAVLKHALTYVRRTPPRYEPVDLRDLVESALFAVRRLPIAGLIVDEALDARLDIPEKLTIDAVEDLLREALINVLKNAIEASIGPGRIRLSITALVEGADVSLVVRDEGRGMTAQQCAREIWRPFGSKKAGGTGLGLPLVKKIIEVDHRGHVEVTSELGIGTTVTIRLPVSQRF
jgi:two-component system phosphate regulon sensor histidine kinase PhoR